VGQGRILTGRVDLSIMCVRSQRIRHSFFLSNEGSSYWIRFYLSDQNNYSKKTAPSDLAWFKGSTSTFRPSSELTWRGAHT
jgi:hypothetical protein